MSKMFTCNFRRVDFVSDLIPNISFSRQCHPSGCLTDLFIQMAIIMVLKQTISNVFEFTGPWVKSIFLINNVHVRCKIYFPNVRFHAGCLFCVSAGSAGGSKGEEPGSCRGHVLTVTWRVIWRRAKDLSCVIIASFETGSATTASMMSTPSVCSMSSWK